VENANISVHWQVRRRSEISPKISSTAHRGLGNLKKAEIEICWPSDQVERHSGIAADPLHWTPKGSPVKAGPSVRLASPPSCEVK
jgi:hypothetical protein